MARVFLNFTFNAKTINTDVKKIINYVIGVEKFVNKEIAKVDKNKILDIVKKETLKIFKANKIRVKAKRTVSILNNFRVTEKVQGSTKTFKIDHKFLTQNITFSHKGRIVTGRTIFNTLDYGRKEYYIPRVNKNGRYIRRGKGFLVWKYGNKKIVWNHILRGPIFVPEKDGLFFMEKAKIRVEEFIEALREKVKNKTKGL